MVHLLVFTAAFLFLAFSPLTMGQRYMTSYQKDFYLPAPLAADNATYSCGTSPIHGNQTNYYIVLSGYQIYAVSYNCFDLYFLGINQTQVDIGLFFCGNVISKIRFYLVAINPNPYLWLTTFAANCQVINDTTGPRDEYFEVDTPVDIFNLTGFSIVPLLSRWTMQGDSLLQAELAVNYFDLVNESAISIVAQVFGTGRRLHDFRTTIVWFNSTALAPTNYPRYRSGFDVFNYGGRNARYFTVADMFGIPSLYYPRKSTIEPRCFIGFSYVRNGGSYIGWSTGAYFNSSTNPFWDAAVLLSARSSYWIHEPWMTGGPEIRYNYQPYHSDYHIFCFDQECPSFTYFQYDTQTCPTCSFACSECYDYDCVKCELGFVLGGRCCLIPGCTYFVHHEDNSQTCYACDQSQFSLNPQKGICECYDGTTLFDGQCVPTITGCIAYDFAADGTNPCLLCNITGLFIGTPTSPFQCSCIRGFEIVEGACQEICGDGLQNNASSSSCDDGNLQSGDGCSSLCETEIYYNCKNGSSDSPSTCVYQGLKLDISLTSTKKTEGANSGTFKFVFDPAIPNLQRMNFSKYLTLTCNSTYSVSSAAYQSGVLEVNVEYTEDLEERQCQLVLAYDPTIVDRAAFHLPFEVQSDNQKLIYYQSISDYKQIKGNFQIIAMVALSLFVFSLPRKMLGVEFLNACQMTYLSLCLYQRPGFLYTAFKGLRLVNGGWFLFTQQDSDQSLLPGFTDTYVISPLFLQASAVVTGFLAFSVLVWGGFLLIRKCINKAKTKTDKIDDKSDANNVEPQQDNNRPEQDNNRPEQVGNGPATAAVKPLKITKRKRKKPVLSGTALIYNWLMFPAVSGFMVFLLLSAFLSCLRPSSSFSVSDELATVNSMAMLFVFTMVGAVMGFELLVVEPYGGADSEPRADLWYIPIFMVKIIITYTVLVLKFSNYLQASISTYSITATETLFLLYLIFKRPYQSGLMNLGAILCALCSAYAVGLTLLEYFYTPSEGTDIMLIYALQGLLGLAGLLTFVRVIKSYYNSFKLYCWKDENSKEGKSKLKGKGRKGQMEVEINQDSLNNRQGPSPYAPYLNKRKGKAFQSHDDSERRKRVGMSKTKEEEDETVKQLKDMLRKNLQEHKAKRQILMEY